MSEPAPAIAGPEIAPAPASGVGRGIAIAAALIMVGNLTSRIFGLIREIAINSQFGVTNDVDVYRILSSVPTQIYDFLVGGLVSAALIPVLSDYVEQDDQPNLWRLISTVLTLLLAALAVIGGAIWLFAGPISRFMATESIATPELAASATRMLRIMTVAVAFMGMSGLLTGLLQAQRRFLLPAFTTSVFNIGMIAVIVLGSSGNAVTLAWGMLVGAVGQMALQLPGLRGARLRPLLDLQHPGVRRVGKLYAPVAIGICFSLVGTLIDRKLADKVSETAAAYMANATTLIQFTLGLVAAAISLAILPTLSRLSTSQDEAGFRRVLGMGLKTVVLIIVPAMVVLAILGRPIIRLMFERGEFTPENTRVTALLLLAYLPSLLAAAVDQPLIFAFYARKHTLLPNLVQGAAVVAYLAVAFASYRAWGIYGLVAGNVAQWIIHALIMIGLAHRQLNVFAEQRMGAALAKIGLAATAMAGVCWALARLVPPGTGKATALLTLVVAGGLSSLVYGGLLWWLKLDALRFFGTAVGKRFRK
jgi:putative peptidoglycan lipid II flippase